MLIICSSCNSKYLVNSADLKPNGRKVQCAKCNNNWFQASNSDEESVPESSVPSSKNNENFKNTNLPSTFVKEQKTSFFNSMLVIFLTIILIFLYWFIKRTGVNFFVLINYYIHEFYFNLRMIIDDLAKIVFDILN